MVLLCCTNLPAPSTASEGSDLFGIQTYPGWPYFFPGEERCGMSVQVTNLRSDDVVIDSVGVHFDWLPEGVYNNATMMWLHGSLIPREFSPVTLAEDTYGEFYPDFDVPANVTASSHAYHVRIGFSTNSSGVLVNGTWLSEPRYDIWIVDFAISIEPPHQSAHAGDSVNYTIRISGLNGFNGSVFLNDIIVGDPSYNPLQLVIQPDGILCPGESTLQVRTDTRDPPGNYTLMVHSGSRNQHHHASIEVTVLPPRTFSMTMTPPNPWVDAGRSCTYTLTATPRNNFTKDIRLELQYSPEGSSVTISPMILHGGGKALVTVTTSRQKGIEHDGICIWGYSEKWSNRTTAQITIIGDTPFNPTSPIGQSFIGAIMLLVTGIIVARASLKKRLTRKRAKE
jgi:hypothetical protein